MEGKKTVSLGKNKKQKSQTSSCRIWGVSKRKPMCECARVWVLFSETPKLLEKPASCCPHESNPGLGNRLGNKCCCAAISSQQQRLPSASHDRLLFHILLSAANDGAVSGNRALKALNNLCATSRPLRPPCGMGKWPSFSWKNQNKTKQKHTHNPGIWKYALH